MTTRFDRRTFIDTSLKSAAGIAIGACLPGDWMRSIASELSMNSPTSDRILVVIQLSGGNDGLNTIVPYNNELYIKARPKLGIASNDVLKIDAQLGLHPSMRGVSELIQSGKFSILQGVGYSSPNRSHFESMDIWHTCQRREARTNDGWLGRLFASESDGEQTDTPGLHLGGEPQPMALSGRGVQIPSIAAVDQMRLKSRDKNTSSMDNDERMSQSDRKSQQSSSDSDLLGFVSTSTEVALQASHRIEKALSAPDSGSDFPESQLGEKLKIVSRLIVAGLTTQVYYVTLDGFDTHANQADAHAGLLRQWSEAISAFHHRMQRDGQGERVLVMTFSEFGRRLAENASQGTDHGAAAPMFFSGPALPMMQVGELPALDDLDDGDLKYHTDFRRVYATVIEKWLGQSSEKSLNGKFESIPGIFS